MLSPLQVLALGLLYGGLIFIGIVVDLCLLRAAQRHPIRWEPRLARMVRRAWDNHDIAVLIFLWVGVFLFVVWLHSWLIETLGLDGGQGMGRNIVIVQSLSLHWAILGVVAFMLMVRQRRWRLWFGMDVKKMRRWAWIGTLAYLAMFPVFVGYTAFYHVALRHIGYEPEVQEIIQTIVAEPHWGLQMYLFLAAVVVAPLAEELVFRGIFFPWMTKRIGVGPAMFLVSLTFAAIHMHVAALLPLFVISVAFCVAYTYSGSLFVPIIMHAMFNGVNLGMLNLIE